MRTLARAARVPLPFKIEHIEALIDKLGARQEDVTAARSFLEAESFVRHVPPMMPVGSRASSRGLTTWCGVGWVPRKHRYSSGIVLPQGYDIATAMRLSCDRNGGPSEMPVSTAAWRRGSFRTPIVPTSILPSARIETIYCVSSGASIRPESEANISIDNEPNQLIWGGAGCRNRTRDLRFTKPLHEF